MRTFSFILLIFFSAFHAAGQRYILGPGDLPGLGVNSADSFAGCNLFGYIDGGADLYLEYGFKKVVVSEYILGEEELKLEVWEMAGPEAAFGIYSLSTFRCLASNTLSLYSCESKYQSAAAYGTLFISAVNRSGSAKGREACNQMVQVIMRLNRQEELKIPALFLMDEFTSQKSTIRFYNGSLGIQNGMPEWSDLINGVNFSMYVIQVPEKHGSGSLAWITFPDQESRTIFLENAGLAEVRSSQITENNSGLFHSVSLVEEHTLLFFESQDTLTDAGKFSALPYQR